jgi:hypothetical protein
MPMKRQTENPKPAVLEGWQQIATFLGEPISVVKR